MHFTKVSSLALIFITIVCLACAQEPVQHSNPSGNTIESRFIPPPSYKRVAIPSNSFGAYLRQLPLKPSGSFVKYYDGTHKINLGVYVGVVDLNIGKKNLHQCADAVIRLWAEYLYQQKKYTHIHFNLTNGFKVEYSRWQKGDRVKVIGNNTTWQRSVAKPSTSYESFWKYLEFIFSYAGTLSLDKELVKVPDLKEIQIGDVFIQGGSPGHAVIVIDMAEDPKTSKKVFLLAQSYMPAQEIQVLRNPTNPELDPWYSTEIQHQLITPEWTFQSSNLKRFKY